MNTVNASCGGVLSLYWTNCKSKSLHFLFYLYVIFYTELPPFLLCSVYVFYVQYTVYLLYL